MPLDFGTKNEPPPRSSKGPPDYSSRGVQLRLLMLVGLLMVTSAFSGCSFCFKDNGGSVFAAHVSPATPTDPSIGAAPALATQLGGQQGTGDFASPQAATAGALQVFGRGFSNLQGKGAGYAVQVVPGMPLTAASMYVFGVVIGHSWHFYSQENNNGVKTVTTLL